MPPLELAVAWCGAGAGGRVGPEVTALRLTASRGGTGGATRSVGAGPGGGNQSVIRSSGNGALALGAIGACCWTVSSCLRQVPPPCQPNMLVGSRSRGHGRPYSRGMNSMITMMITMMMMMLMKMTG